MDIQISRVYTPPPVKNGIWMLVDRLWPRGLKKEALALDYWSKDLAPSSALRQWFHADPAKRWQEFSEKYREELHQKETLLTEVQALAKKSPLTLFYAAKDTEHNHAILLQAVLLAHKKCG